MKIFKKIRTWIKSHIILSIIGATVLICAIATPIIIHKFNQLPGVPCDDQNGNRHPLCEDALRVVDQQITLSYRDRANCAPVNITRENVVILICQGPFQLVQKFGNRRGDVYIAYLRVYPSPTGFNYKSGPNWRRPVNNVIRWAENLPEW